MSLRDEVENLVEACFLEHSRVQEGLPNKYFTVDVAECPLATRLAPVRSKRVWDVPDKAPAGFNVQKAFIIIS
jgi:hypothetical protein